MNLPPLAGPGSTPSRRRFWNQAREVVLASQKIAGRFVTVDEHQGKGSVINVPESNRRGAAPCNQCATRHLSIKFRCAGNIQTDGCFPNSGLLSWDCGLLGTPTPYEVDINPCEAFSHNFVLDYSDALCMLWEDCSAGGNPVVCDWHAGVKLSLSDPHTFHFEYNANTYTASVAGTFNCNGVPTVVDATYDATVDGFPDLPPDISVPDWCAVVGTQLFSDNNGWGSIYTQGICNCFGGTKTVVLGFQLFFYIDVT